MAKEANKSIRAGKGGAKPVKQAESGLDRLPRYYFPLVIGIVLIEAVVLVLVLLQIIPLHDFEVYSFAQYFQYIAPGDVNHIAVTITRWFFFALTAGVMIPVTLLIILEVIRRIIIHVRGETPRRDDRFQFLEFLDRSPRNPNITKDRVQGDYITRFDIHQRIQHYVLFITFIILGITGLIRGFPNWPVFSAIININGAPDVLRLIHDVAAFGMILDCIYHLLYVAHGIFVKKKLPTAMVPNMKDMKDMLHTMLWTVGLYSREPDFEHFQYGQKIDYWAIFWGMPVMVITGIIMMFASSIPWDGQWFAVVATAHRDEAILAVSFIIIVHMYYGHLQTTAFPVNTVMFTGRMLKSKYKQWFGREYDDLMEKVEDKTTHIK